MITLILFVSASLSHAAPSPKDQASAQPVTAKTAQAAPPKTQWAFANQFAIRYNPLGLQNETFIGYRSKLYNKPHDNLLFGKAYWWVGGVARVSPQFAQAGVFFRTLPIAILELQGIFSHVAGFKDSSEIQGYYTDGTRDAVGNTESARAATGNFIGSGWQASLQARLQIKVGSIAIRSTNLFRRFDLNGEGNQLDDDLFYDQTLDVITPFQSWVYQNDVDVLYVKKASPWVVGARYTITKPLTDPSSPDVNADAIYDIQRAGLLFAWKFKANPTAQGLEARRRHALIVLSQWHLDHSYRVGQSMNKLIPYFAVVYSLSGRVGSDR